MQESKPKSEKISFKDKCALASLLYAAMQVVKDGIIRAGICVDTHYIDTEHVPYNESIE